MLADISLYGWMIPLMSCREWISSWQLFREECLVMLCLFITENSGEREEIFLLVNHYFGNWKSCSRGKTARVLVSCADKDVLASWRKEVPWSQSTCYSIHRKGVVLSDLEETLKERMKTGCSQIVAAEYRSVLCRAISSGYRASSLC